MPESMVSVFCPQYAEHGRALRKPAGGEGSWPGLAAAVALAAVDRPGVATYWFTPTVPETTPASDEGIVMGPSASRTRCPFTS
jgi:hypothetical protein